MDLVLDLNIIIDCSTLSEWHLPAAVLPSGMLEDDPWADDLDLGTAVTDDITDEQLLQYEMKALRNMEPTDNELVQLAELFEGFTDCDLNLKETSYHGSGDHDNLVLANHQLADESDDIPEVTDEELLSLNL